MKITSVSLQNVKSYDDDSPSIVFQSGVNAIIGENGSGKSTLCEAVGFALFDFLHPYSQADFVREGCKSGKVIVTFESDNTNRVYRVERGVGQSKYDVFDETNDTKLSLRGKEDVLVWLKDELGVPSSMDLQTLWKSSIGVPQGKFTNDFAETPSIRAQLFNPLLEVEVYRDLWRKMKGVVDVIEEQKNQLSEQITRLESVIQDLPDLEKQLNQRKKQIQHAKNIVEQLKDEINAVEQKKERLEDLRKEIEQLNHNLSLNQEKQQDLEKQLIQTKKEYTEAKEAKDIVSTHEKQYEDYVSNTKKLEKLAEKNKEKQVVEKKQVALEKKQSLYEQQLQQVKESVRIAEKSKEEMESLKPKVEQQNKLEEKRADVAQKEKEINQKKKEIEEINEKISRLRSEFRSLKKKINQISEKKEIANKRAELQDKKDELIQNRSVVNHQQTEHEKAISLLKDKEKSVCPTCSRPLDEAHRMDIIEQKEKIIVNAKKRKDEIAEELDHVSTQLKKAQQAEQEIKRLADLESMLSSIQLDADEYKKKKNSLDETINSLQNKIAEKDAVQQKLEQLDDPKKAFQKAKVRFEDHKGKKEKQKELQEKLFQVKKEKDSISQKLDAFNDVQTEIDSLKQMQKKLKDSYEQYLRYKDASSKLSYWKEQVNTLDASLKDVKKKISIFSEKLAKEKKDFDKDLFNNVKNELETKKKQRIQQETQIDEWEKQKSDLDRLVSEKRKQEKELTEFKKKKHSLKKDIEFACFLRETYQKSRPLVTEILVEEISREADRIYRELRGVPSEELAWKKDYEIVVYERGNKRAFHKLSGGEQMCAALSVRLAILKLLSTMDIVFLDEPTMNLDEGKKDNLVGQLRELSGFSQIFVISHDETFESMTEHVITLEKRQNATRLLSHFQGGF